MSNENYFIHTRFDYVRPKEDTLQKERDKSELEVKCFRWGMPCCFCDEYVSCPALEI
jgi:hypothetical protein